MHKNFEKKTYPEINTIVKLPKSNKRFWGEIKSYCYCLEWY